MSVTTSEAYGVERRSAPGTKVTRSLRMLGTGRDHLRRARLTAVLRPRSARHVPGLAVARGYRRAWVRGDVIAALVLVTLLVPQGMAYAELAGLPPVTGLYTTVVALLAYAVFGPSRILVLGPDSALGPLIVAAILPLLGAHGDPATAVALAGMLALLMGAMCVDRRVRPRGHPRGAALEAGARRLPQRHRDRRAREPAASALRLQRARRRPVRREQGVRRRCRQRRDRHREPARRRCVARGDPRVPVHWLPKVPGILVAVVGAAIATKVFDLTAHGVLVVGQIPSGFPTPILPRREPARRGEVGRRGRGNGVRHAGRHDDPVAEPRVEARRARRQRPGDHRARHGKPRGRAVHRVPGQRVGVAYRGRRVRGLPHPAHGRARRGRHRA